MKQISYQEFLSATGKVPYCMTNDYLFRAVFQVNNKALRGLICALLHLSENAGRQPVKLAGTLCHVPMPLLRPAKPVVHIGFLDYSLFKECPEFYASYKLINVKTHQKYSDNLTLHVIDLSHIELATEEDKKYHIHEWAALFKADTWEEVRMIATKDEYLAEAAQTMFRMSADDLVRKRCLDREEYYQDLRNYERAIAESKRKRELDRLEHEQDLARLNKTVQEQSAQIEHLLAEIIRLKEQ